MRSVTFFRPILKRLRTAAVASALACAASGAYACAASVVINGFTIGTNADPTVFVFAPTDYMNQVWDLRALDGGGAIAQQLVSGSVPDWSNVDQTAQTPMAKATVSSSQGTDVLTQLITPLFTLAANASGINNTGLGSMISSGAFCFGDGAGFDGTSSGCNAAGELTFTVYYDLIVSLALGDVPGSLAAAGASLHVTNDDGSVSTALSDLASTGMSGSKLGQSFTFTLALNAGDAGFFDLAGLAGVETPVVPEPNVLGLLGLGLFALAAARRRRGPLCSVV